MHGLVLEDPPVDGVLDVAQLLVGQGLAVGEVEAQLVRADVRARLPHVGAEPPPERRVQQVRGGVVALGRVPRGAIDVRVDALARLDRAALRHER